MKKLLCFAITVFCVLLMLTSCKTDDSEQPANTETTVGAEAETAANEENVTDEVQDWQDLSFTLNGIELYLPCPLSDFTDKAGFNVTEELVDIYKTASENVHIGLLLTDGISHITLWEEEEADFFDENGDLDKDIIVNGLQVYTDGGYAFLPSHSSFFLKSGIMPGSLIDDAISIYGSPVNTEWSREDKFYTWFDEGEDNPEYYFTPLMILSVDENKAINGFELWVTGRQTAAS